MNTTVNKYWEVVSGFNAWVAKPFTSLIIHFKGLESSFETRRLVKPLIVVVIEDLTNNHRRELVEELTERKHLF
ncbi:hypothetical protein Ccrd_022493 [Cynara cardunculus var. scolymus]|uniref:Uncharacterized protein n=1 Tax=Cynara cardunculus var. scolymus TaxID=59895 RepID=A0A103XYI5_CYNCS|nr:hypothetical protein Ccrd_022493 [Cynara cardunculus var. scolymus]